MDDGELVEDFMVESHENLDQLDQDLVTLEADPTNPEMLSRIFRTIHTIKGTCGFLGFTKLEWVTHVGENLLSRLRDGELQLNDEITTALLSLVDAVREILGNIETSAHEGDADYGSLIATMTRLQEGSQRATDAAPSSATEMPPVSTSRDGDIQATITLAHAETSAGTSDGNSAIDQRVEQFLIESHEHADQVDRDLVTLESDPTNPELLSRIVGTLHTLKGSSGFLGFTATESATHAAESLLIGLRDGTCQLNPEITTALLSLVDMVRQVLVSIETKGNEEEVDYTTLIATFKRLQDTSEVVAMETSKATPQERMDAAARDDGVALATAGADDKTQTEARASASVPTQSQVATESPKSHPPPQTQATRPQSVTDTSIRVDVGLLDVLMDQVGELVLARNRIMQFATLQDDRGVLAAYQRLDLITSELQEGVMKTRMQPIGTIWNKFPRVVRDLARDCGKQVNLSMDGEETELDRTLIEAIRDPLTHLVRNAVDHGIETPEVRRLAGKSETGDLFLRAFHEGGLVNIEIADDGGGIDPERIVRQAMDRNLITVQQAAQMNQREILNLVFAPGFTTADTVTNVSGRGVGMDVVKTNIEKINGTVDVQSQVGRGSSIKIKIPLTLAIIPALIIRCAGDRYAIPQASLIELLRLEGDDVHTKIESIHGAPVYRLRGQLLPLVYLRNEFTVEGSTSKEQGDQDNHVINIVVLEADQRHFGLVVDNVLDTEEIVVKPLGKHVKNIAVFAGATIMGDGNVALILDVFGLAQRARVLSERREHLQTDKSAEDQGPNASHETLLLFEIAAGQRMALPLSRVTRLEKFPWSEVEQSGQCEVVQYWGQVMPLIHLSKCLSGGGMQPPPTDTDLAEQGTLKVVVLNIRSRSIGLVVDHILDTVEERFEIQPLRSRSGVIGTVMVQGHVTELLDLDEIIQKANPALFTQLASAEVER
jgi:two-component system chemotaxis sensor kinase CheA